MGRTLGFLLVGVAFGFVLANVIRKVQQEYADDPHSLAEDIERRLDALETQSSQA